MQISSFCFVTFAILNLRALFFECRVVGDAGRMDPVAIQHMGHLSSETRRSVAIRYLESERSWLRSFRQYWRGLANGCRRERHNLSFIASRQPHLINTGTHSDETRLR